VRFFLDNCLSPRYARSLDALSEKDGHKVFHLQDKFSRDAKDRDWIRALGQEGGWVIVSGDTRILRTPELKSEWAQARLTAFFLGSGWMNVGYWQQIASLVKWWPTLLEQARLVEYGTGFEVPFRTSRLKPVIARRSPS
jgi:PIN like domain